MPDNSTDATQPMPSEIMPDVTWRRAEQGEYFSVGTADTRRLVEREIEEAVSRRRRHGQHRDVLSP